MIQLRPSNERGGARYDWLDTRHSFSFDQYYDPRYMGFGHLRVLNEDWISPGAGFPTHPHRDMEIVTYPLEGAIEHKDSMGNGSVIRPGEVQRMSAGTGIFHSEFNPSKTEATHMLQIWIRPRARGITPTYEQKALVANGGGLRPVASPDGRDGSVTIQADVVLYAGRMKAGEMFTHQFAPSNTGWLQVARGAVTLNGAKLAAGDGAAIKDEARIEIVAADDAELLLFDMMP
ncbi:MAG: pirin family protein [Bryobacteraceae bacterium]|nr:pirin family protein [Bryobacteraceae bacterium]